MRKNKLTFVFTSIVALSVLVTGLQLFAAPTALFAAVGQATQAAGTQNALYTTCEESKLSAPLGQGTAQPTSAATVMATATGAAPAATQASAPAGGDDIVFLSIVGSESEACYLATETFLPGNFMKKAVGFNNPVGVTHTIAGDLALDRTNVANSQIGDIKINVSQFQTDDPRRDGFVRQNFLQSNKYPYATLTDVTLIGLPNGPYKDGTKLKFQVKGTLTVHNTPRPTTFDASGSYSNGVLVVTAQSDVLMTDFGIQQPVIPGLVTADNAVRLMINLVARPSSGTPAATQGS